MKILIVEDEEILGRVLKEKFEKERDEVELVTDGDLVMAAAEVFRPDVVVLDLILPKRDGLEVLKDLKASPEFKQIPVVVLSNLGQDEEIKNALRLGAADYLVKTQHPINEVVEKIKAYGVKGR